MTAAVAYSSQLDPSRETIEWGPHLPAQPTPELSFYARVFAHLERNGAVDGLRVIATRATDSAPAVGDDVVALVLLDELARPVRYAPQVRIVLKTYGTQLHFPWQTLLPPSAPAAVGALSHAQYRARTFRERGRAPSLRNVLTVPLGTYRQLDVPLVPFAERDIDVGFAGSAVHDPTASITRRARSVLRPKEASRAAMLRAVSTWATQHPERNVRLRTTPGFHELVASDEASYSDELMRTKVCLVPRGTSFETYRYFEALRSGCVVVTEPQPPWWFYAGAPVVEVRRWRDAPRILDRLLGDQPRLQSLHESSLAWWDSTCSPEAVASRIAALLRAPFVGNCPS